MIGIDHNRRIQAQLHAAAENKAIDDMERNARPLFIVLAVCFAALITDGLLDAYATHKYAGQIHASEMFVQALNGTAIDTGEGVATCTVRNNQLVANLSKVPQ
jgi:hypothetical protein